MKVRVVVEYSDHRRPHYAVDEVLELEEDEAARIIAKGLVEAVAEIKVPEAATLEPDEDATYPHRARKRRP